MCLSKYENKSTGFARCFRKVHFSFVGYFVLLPYRLIPRFYNFIHYIIVRTQCKRYFSKQNNNKSTLLFSWWSTKRKYNFKPLLGVLITTESIK